MGGVKEGRLGNREGHQSSPTFPQLLDCRDLLELNPEMNRNKQIIKKWKLAASQTEY